MSSDMTLREHAGGMIARWRCPSPSIADAPPSYIHRHHATTSSVMMHRSSSDNIIVDDASFIIVDDASFIIGQHHR